MFILACCSSLRKSTTQSIYTPDALSYNSMRLYVISWITWDVCFLFCGSSIIHVLYLIKPCQFFSYDIVHWYAMCHADLFNVLILPFDRLTASVYRPSTSYKLICACFYTLDWYLLFSESSWIFVFISSVY
jgi:hypothetical protein